MTRVDALKLFMSVVFAHTVACAAVDVDGHYAWNAAVTVQGLGDGQMMEDFPVLVRMDSIPGFSVRNALSEGADLMFVDASGNPLSYDVDTWSNSGALVWVLLPSAENGTEFKVYWGGAEPNAANDPKTVWADYSQVWHFDGDADASGRIQGSAVARGVAVQDVDPMLGACFRDGDVALPMHSVSENAKRSFSMWVKPSEDLSFGVRRILSSKTYAAGQGLDCFVNEGLLHCRANGNAHTVSSSGAAGFVKDSWVHIGVSFWKADDVFSASLYVNGVAVGTGSLADGITLDAQTEVLAGNINDGSGTYRFKGLMDEIRFYDGTADSERIAADYATVAEPGFLSYSAAEPILAGYAKNDRLVIRGIPEGVTLENFPALVRLNLIKRLSAEDFRSADGGDLLFTLEDGTALSHEIDTWDVSGGRLLAWVAIPRVTHGTVLRVFWGKESSSSFDSADVWSAGGYKTVLHFSEEGVEAVDSSGVCNGTNGANTAYVESGMVGAARKTSTATSTASVGHEGVVLEGYRSVALGDSACVSAWVRHDSSIPMYYDRFFVRRFHATDEEGGGFAVQWSGESDSAPLSVYGSNYGNPGTVNVTGARSGDWMHVAVAYQGTAATVYVNGVAQGDVEVAAMSDGKPLVFGHDYRREGGAFHGDMDECRIRQGAVSPEWIAAEYATASDPAFIEYPGRGFTMTVR